MSKYILIILTAWSISTQATVFSNEVYRKMPLGSLPITAKHALQKAFDAADYYDHKYFAKKRWMMVVDFSQNSKNKRGYLINLKRKTIESYYVSHGENSGDGQGNTTTFSNVDGSHQSSIGLYITGETYIGKHGKSLRLHGLSSTNDLAHQRLIVIHSAPYVSPETIARQGFLGTSWGCPAVEAKAIKRIIRKLDKKHFYYIYHEKQSN